MEKDYHGLSKHPLYFKWQSIKQRCYNENDSAYKNYGAKGVTVCDEWNNCFVSFYNWSLKNWYDGIKVIDKYKRINIDLFSEIIECYFSSNISMRKISRLTGISRSTISRHIRGTE